MSIKMSKPYIAGLFQNATEQKEPVTGQIVKGYIPHWLEGRLYRVGPGIFDLEGGFTVNFYMDGFAIIGKFEFSDGEVTYCQKLLESEAYTKAQICKHPVFAEFGTPAQPDMTKNLIKRIFSRLVPTDLTDNNVSNIFPLEDELIVSSETCMVHTIDKGTLAKKEKINISKILPGNFLFTSHPIKDTDGNTWNIGISCRPTPKYHIIKIPPTGNAEKSLKEAKIICSVPAIKATALTFVHSFAMTEKYIVFMEQPLQVSIIKMAQMGIKKARIKDAFDWHPEMTNRFHVIEKATGEHLTTPLVTDNPYFSMHYVNAYEENSQIILDVVTYPSAQVLENAELKKLRNNQYSREDISQFQRFVLPVISDVKKLPEDFNLVNSESLYTSLAQTRRIGDRIVMTPQPIREPGLEFPTINPKYIGRPYRYFYASGTYIPFGFYQNAICKIDLITGDTRLHKTDYINDFFGEVYFIPRDDCSPDEVMDEDDGVVISCVTSSEPQRPDYLLILDGRSFKIVARIEFSVKIPLTLHGYFLKE